MRLAGPDDEVPFTYGQHDHVTTSAIFDSSPVRTCSLCRESYSDRRGGMAICNTCSSEGASYERKLVRERARTAAGGRTARLNERRIELMRQINPDLTCQWEEDGAVCGEHPSDLSQLHIDHVDGKSYRSRTLSLSSRIARYKRELTSGVKLRLLCQMHNCGHLNNSWRDRGR